MEQEGIIKKIEGRFKGSVLSFKDEKFASFVSVKPGYIHQIMEFLKKDDELKFDFLRCVSGVDLKERFEIVYHLYSYGFKHSVILKTEVSRKEPRLDSLSDIYGAANWFEREVFDLFGIVFNGHPDLRRIMLPDDWAGHPLRKDYEEPSEYRGISHKR